MMLCVRLTTSVYINVPQFSMISGNTHQENQSSYKSLIQLTSVLLGHVFWRPVEISFQVPWAHLVNLAVKETFFVFKPTLYVISCFVCDSSPISRSASCPLQNTHLSPKETACFWHQYLLLWVAMEPCKENHTLYFSSSLQMKIERMGQKAVRGAV